MPADRRSSEPPEGAPPAAPASGATDAISEIGATDAIGEISAAAIARATRAAGTDPAPAANDPARRQIVLHPRTASARRIDRVRATSSQVRGYSTDADDVLGYVAEQRRLALATFVPVVAALALLLALTATTDVFGDRDVAGVPVLWLVLGPITLGLILLAAAWHERRALRLEDRWAADHRGPP